MKPLDIASLRAEYKRSSLLEEDVKPNPMEQFSIWFEQALKAGITEPNAMSLGTSKNNIPDNRIVLLKQADDRGFSFFSHYNSEKGLQIDENPYVALNFLWLELERQVRIKGIVERLSDIENDGYFYSRPLESQVGAIVSAQSSVIPSREYLENRYAEELKKAKSASPKRPETWGGYLVKPISVEFWQGRPARLHDRILYSKKENKWEISRLAP